MHFMLVHRMPLSPVGASFLHRARKFGPIVRSLSRYDKLGVKGKEKCRLKALASRTHTSLRREGWLSLSALSRMMRFTALALVYFVAGRLGATSAAPDGTRGWGGGAADMQGRSCVLRRQRGWQAHWESRRSSRSRSASSAARSLRVSLQLQ